VVIFYGGHFRQPPVPTRAKPLLIPFNDQTNQLININKSNKQEKKKMLRESNL
jgi:hypothetical protein